MPRYAGASRYAWRSVMHSGLTDSFMVLGELHQGEYFGEYRSVYSSTACALAYTQVTQASCIIPLLTSPLPHSDLACKC